MLREIVLWVQRTTHNFCCGNPNVQCVQPRGPCRTVPKICLCSKVIFFLAIFMPLWICLLSDILRMLKNRKVGSKRN